jgi:hypothetical protein
MLKEGSNEEENGLREIKMESSLLNKQSIVFFILLSHLFNVLSKINIIDNIIHLLNNDY